MLGAFVCSYAHGYKLASIKADQIPTGFKASIELDVIRNAADEWFDTIVNILNGIKLPDIDIDKKKDDYLRSNTFYIG
jgi:hypothetical protein